MPRPVLLPLPLPIPSLAALRSGRVGRRLRRLARSGLAWWLCALAVGAVAADRLAAAEADLARARAAWGRTVEVAVAARDLPAGHRLRAGDLEAARWPAAVVGGPAGSAPTAADLVGRTLAAPVVAGEAVLAVRLTAGGAGAVAARVPPGHGAVGLVPLAAPPLAAGDRVDVVDAGADPPVPVATGALVVDVGTGGGNGAGGGGGPVTVAVPAAEAPALARAAATTTLAVVLVGP